MGKRIPQRKENRVRSLNARENLTFELASDRLSKPFPCDGDQICFIGHYLGCCKHFVTMNDCSIMQKLFYCGSYSKLSSLESMKITPTMTKISMLKTNSPSIVSRAVIKYTKNTDEANVKKLHFDDHRWRCVQQKKLKFRPFILHPKWMC